MEKDNNDQLEQETSAQTSDMNNEPDTNSPSSDSAPKSHLSFYAALVVIILVLGGAAWWMLSQDKMGSDEQVQIGNDYPEVVAIVNGVEIKREAFLESLAQTEQAAAAGGADIEDLVTREEIRRQSLDVLINTELLTQAADASEVEVTDEQVNEQFSGLEAQYGDSAALAAEMEKFGLTEEELRSNIRKQLLVENFITQTEEYQNVTVSDAEAKELYDSLTTQGQQLPPFAEIAEQVKQSILTQKQQQAIGQLIGSLKATAEIEMMI